MSTNRYRKYKVKAKVWLYQGHAGWHFITLPTKLYKEISVFYEGLTRGWGSLPVNSKLGKTIWKTSIFPDKKEKIYLLAIKQSVRKAENVKAGDTVTIEFEILV